MTSFNPDEALFDWFNVNMRNLGGLPLTATIGRQDMIFGVGWLVLDASPLDGSRTDRRCSMRPGSPMTGRT